MGEDEGEVPGLGERVGEGEGEGSGLGERAGEGEGEGSGLGERVGEGEGEGEALGLGELVVDGEGMLEPSLIDVASLQIVEDAVLFARQLTQNSGVGSLPHVRQPDKRPEGTTPVQSKQALFPDCALNAHIEQMVCAHRGDTRAVGSEGCMGSDRAAGMARFKD